MWSVRVRWRVTYVYEPAVDDGGCCTFFFTFLGSYCAFETFLREELEEHRVVKKEAVLHYDGVANMDSADERRADAGACFTRWS